MKVSKQAHISYKTGAVHDCFTFKLNALLDASVDSINNSNLSTQRFKITGAGESFTAGGKTKVPDGSVRFLGQGIIAVEVLVSQPWSAVGELASDYQQMGFHHLVCFKMVRVNGRPRGIRDPLNNEQVDVDALFYIHFNYVLGTAHICCFSGITTIYHNLMPVSGRFSLLSGIQIDHLTLSQLNLDYNMYWLDTRNGIRALPQLVWVDPVPVDHVLHLPLYDNTEQSFVGRNHLIPIPFDTVGLSVVIDLPELTSTVLDELVVGDITEEDLQVNSGSL